jgi:superfamily II DNA or RNA helicase
MRSAALGSFILSVLSVVLMAEFERLVTGGRAVVTAPTGSGKTIVASALVASAVATGQRVLVLAHRRETIDQTVSKLRDDQQGEEVP